MKYIFILLLSIQFFSYSYANDRQNSPVQLNDIVYSQRDYTLIHDKVGNPRWKEGPKVVSSVIFLNDEKLYNYQIEACQVDRKLLCFKKSQQKLHSYFERNSLMERMLQKTKEDPDRYEFIMLPNGIMYAYPGTYMTYLGRVAFSGLDKSRLSDYISVSVNQYFELDRPLKKDIPIYNDDGDLMHTFNKGDFIGFRGHLTMSRSRDVSSAGEIKVNRGRVLWINNCSGHYKPTVDETKQILRQFELTGSDIRAIPQITPCTKKTK
ncbi:hypothetical protein HJA72_004306 [Vibrio fluvialis]|nr:hypothetical protein [Vibrio fluvialis]